MSATLDTKTSLRPVFEGKPDMRFATTFLSNKYRDYAVKGETIQDKVTGEIFTKRKEDGRVVSFFQNKKYLHDMMLELRVLLNNNDTFRYPDETEMDAFYVSTDYDMMTIFNEKDVDITLTDIDLSSIETPTSRQQIAFKISKKSNGFFCRITSRDSDKAIIEWVTNQYNSIIKNYTGTIDAFKTESRKFTTEKWEDSNATLNYTINLTTEGNTQSFTFDTYIRVNEESCVTFPATFGPTLLEGAESVEIVINSVKFEKLRFMLDNKALLPSEFITGYDSFIYPDKAIYIRYTNICSFVDKSTDIELLGNEFIIALVDIPYLYRYMMKMSMLAEDSTIILSPTKPGNDLWKSNGIWAERVRDVFEGGVTVKLDSVTNLKQLEEFIAEGNDTDYVILTTDANDTENIYGEEV